jgi:hypothetical protein
MKELLFLNPIHKSGRNLTVRRGIKWSLENEANVQGLSSEEKFSRQEIETAVVLFRDLRDGDLKNEHDPSCRNYYGLLCAMKRAYPTFDERELVTLVYYEA